MNEGSRRVLEDRIASKQAMARLLEVSNLCVRADSRFGDCLAGILDAAINLTGADKGNIQLPDAASGSLVIAAQRGFEEPFLNIFANVRAGEAVHAAPHWMPGRELSWKMFARARCSPTKPRATC
jgi:hypothetical protein